MPHFTDFLFAPWKVIGIFLTGGNSVTVNPTTAAAASQGNICYSQDVSGQLLHICRIGSIEMPSFVFYASWGILLFFAATAFTLLRETNRLGAGLAKLASELEAANSNGRSGTSKDVESLRRILMKEPLTAGLWTQFEDTLLPLEDDEVYTTQTPDSVFSRAAVIDDNLHGAFYAAIPGILTGVGLLMTFVAILDGLSHVSVSANMDVKGIGGLINGLSGKFVSSIVAVSCAVSFVFVERFAHSRPAQGYRRLVQVLNSRFRRRTTEYLLAQIHDRLRGVESGGSSPKHAPKRAQPERV